MPPLQLLEINFTPYIPTTSVGLLGLVFGYLYFYFKNKNDNKLKQIKSVNTEQRNKAIEAQLSELGVSIDTSKLTANQKYELLVKSLTAKTRKYLITASTIIVIAVVMFFILKDERTNATDPVASKDGAEVIEDTSKVKDKENRDRPYKEFTLSADQQHVMNDLQITLKLPTQKLNTETNTVKIRIWRNIQRPLSDTAFLDPNGGEPGVEIQVIKVNAITPISITDVGQFRFLLTKPVMSGQKVQSIQVKMYRN